MDINITLADELDPVAVYAALVATAVLFWDVVKWWTTGPRLKVTASANMVRAGDTTLGLPKKTFILVRVVNAGSSPTTIKILGLTYYDGFIRKLRRRPSKAMIVGKPEMVPQHSLPYILHPGEEWAGLIDQDDELVGMARSGYLYAEVYDALGRKPVRTRVTVPSGGTE